MHRPRTGPIPRPVRSGTAASPQCRPRALPLRSAGRLGSGLGAGEVQTSTDITPVTRQSRPHLIGGAGSLGQLGLASALSDYGAVFASGSGIDSAWGYDIFSWSYTSLMLSHT